MTTLESSDHEELLRILKTEFQAEEDHAKQILETLTHVRLDTIERFREALSWYATPIMGFKPITSFPKDQKDLDDIASRLLTALTMSWAHEEEPYKDREG